MVEIFAGRGTCVRGFITAYTLFQQKMIEMGLVNRPGLECSPGVVEMSPVVATGSFLSQMIDIEFHQRGTLCTQATLAWLWTSTIWLAMALMAGWGASSSSPDFMSTW